MLFLRFFFAFSMPSPCISYAFLCFSYAFPVIFIVGQGLYIARYLGDDAGKEPEAKKHE